MLNRICNCRMPSPPNQKQECETGRKKRPQAPTVCRTRAISKAIRGGIRGLSSSRELGRVAKAALEAGVRYLSYDLGPDNIRVNGISAGPVKTLAARGIADFTNMLKHHADKAPLKRNVLVEEVAGTALFLASPLSGGITGEVIHVDCGYSIMAM